jgi:hypothetical protein
VLKPECEPGSRSKLRSNPRFFLKPGTIFILVLILAGVVLSAQPSLGQDDPVTISHDETLFTALAAINNCGYDAELGTSDGLRGIIRGEIGHNVEQSETARSAANAVCGVYRDHQQADDTRTLSQYVSLALYMNPPPAFTTKVKESDLPPDASGVLGLIPVLSKFYTEVGVHQIWESHAAGYQELESRYHDALTKMVRDTELYLRLPSGGYEGRTFRIFVEPLGAPSEINARNYGTEYFVMVSPGSNSTLKMEQIRHAYLHYLIDPAVGKFAASLTRLDPLLDALKLAPMDESFKSDASLLVTECVIRSIEARTAEGGKAPLGVQDRMVEDSARQGFVLTRYFYDRLLEFEKSDVGFRNFVPQMLSQIDVRREQRRASQIQFANDASPELLQLARPKQGKLLETAQERLSAGDAAAAEKLAKQALAEKSEDPGRALFILAQVSLRGNMDGARDYFEQALKATTEPKVVAWSHIYLGRILDLRDNDENGPSRAQAVAHYKAAVDASNSLPEAKAAAERGLDKPFQAPQKASTDQGSSDKQ